MIAKLKLGQGMRLAGYNEKGIITYFDSHKETGGDDSAATPMEVMLQALAGCTAMDVLSMLRKKKKTINDFEIYLNSERASEHPRVFTKVNMTYELTSPDTNYDEFKYIVSLSQDKYCSVSAMFKKSGCEVLWNAVIK